jgi:hypothetical protein
MILFYCFSFDTPFIGMQPNTLHAFAVGHHVMVGVSCKEGANTIELF